MKHILQKSRKIACSGILMFSLLAATGSLLATGVQTARAEEIALARDIAQSNSFSQNAKLQSLVEGETAVSASAGTDVVFDVARDYGGVYLDEDKILNVCLVENEYLESNRAYITEYLSEEQEVRIAPVRYSLQELNGLKEELEGQTESLSINGLGVSQTGNKVTVTLSDMAEEEELVALSALAGYEAEMLSVKQGDAAKAQASYTAYNGEAIAALNLVTSSAYSGSIGAFAVDKNDTNKFGIVTAGHLVVDQAYGTDISYSQIYTWTGSAVDNFIGGSSSTFCKDSGTFDSAFVPFSSQRKWNISYQCHYKKDNVEAYESIDDIAPSSMMIEGASLSKYGATTYATTGTIQNISWQTYYFTSVGTKKNLSDLVVADYESEAGDSGGCVFIQTYDATTHIYTNYMVGIHQGTRSDDLALFSKIENVQEGLEIEVITKANYSTYCA